MFVVCAVGRDGVEEWGFGSKRLRLLSRIGRYEHALRSIRACVTVDTSMCYGRYEHALRSIRAYLLGYIRLFVVPCYRA